VADLENYTVERGIIVAYGAMIPGALLERVPMLNVHFSLLPRWRGAAPVERAILAGDAETGVAIMSLEPSLDTGPVHLEVRTRIGDKTAKELTEELALLGASALVEVLASEELLNHPTVQSGDVTYAEKLDKETLHLEPGKPLATLERTVRLGGAFTFVNERRVAVMRAHGVHVDANAGTLLEVPGGIALVGSDGALVLDTVRPEGSRPMSSAAWWAGARADIASSRWA
jgi:methionyl-tRNA formyltransferase